MGFRLLDYSTRSLVTTETHLLVPRRATTMLPLVELTYSSVRLRERRNYFDTFQNVGGDLVVPDAPVGSYSVQIFAENYIPFEQVYTSPMASPVEILLHRDPSFRFSPEDTLLRGEVVNSAGEPHTGFDVQLIDPEPMVPGHLVPLNQDGRFVIYVPEKQTTGGVDVRIFYPLGSVLVNFASVLLNRTNVAPLTTVP